MKQKFKLIGSVAAINSKGEQGYFDLEKPVDKEKSVSEEDKEIFFGEKFRGRKDDGTICDFVVTKVFSIQCVPECFYLTAVNAATSKSHGLIKLGNYDSPDDVNPDYRKSPLTRLTVNFEMEGGEGLIFNRKDKYGSVVASQCRWTKKDYVITRWEDEVWTLPKSEWELHLSPDPEIDYWDPDDLRDSLPELRQ